MRSILNALLLSALIWYGIFLYLFAASPFEPDTCTQHYSDDTCFTLFNH